MSQNKLKSFYSYFRKKLIKKDKITNNSRGNNSKENMTNKKNIIRLSKAAKEFNVGSGTIVEFLRKKGYELESKPNTKLTPEIYNILISEYSKEKSVKEESKKHGFSTSRKSPSPLKEENETDEEVLKTEESDVPDEKILFIKNSSVPSEKPVQETAHKKEEKIDPPKVESKQKKTKKVSESKSGEKPESKSEEKPETKSGEKSESKSETNVAKNSTPKATEKSPEKETEKSTPKATEKSPEKETEKSTPKATKKSLESTKKETSDKKQDSEKDSTGLHVLGTIDLDSMNQKTRPDKKSKKEKAAEKKRIADQKKTSQPKDHKANSEKHPEKKKEGKHPEKQDTHKQKQKADAKKKEHKKAQKTPVKEKKVEEVKKAPTKIAGEEDKIIKVSVEKLNGPKILGTIELPKKPKKTDHKKPDFKNKKKPVASSNDDKLRAKKKRRRIRKPAEQDKTKTTQAGGQKTTGQKTTGQGAGQKTNRSRNFKSSQRTRPDVKKRIVKHEPTEAEIQKQIKDTLARLSGGSKKSKSSKYRKHKRDVHSTKQKEIDSQQEKQLIKVTEFVTVNELATMIETDVNKVISVCMSLGLMVAINQRLDAETIVMVAEEFHFEVEFVSIEVQEALELHGQTEEDESKLVPRAPVVTVMGHVDHGKTSLLDFIRKKNVIAGEAGGITQHIGAYEVTTSEGKNITFLDTPGHEAFTAMRARGAKVTDIAIIIIAADDDVMPQSIEAINHAQAAGVPIIFAINKIDRPNANPEKIKEQLSQRNILVEDWGGKYQSQEISAKEGTNVDLLLEKILLESEMLELKGNPKKAAFGTVIESSLDKGRGYVTNLLVQNGTLKKGDYILAGSHSGKIKAMYNENNIIIDKAGPSAPLLMLGLDGAPQAGDQFYVMSDEREARDIASKRKQLQREQGIRTQKHITLDEIGRRIAVGDFKELNIIVKGDVDGSVEALADSLLKLTNEEIQVNIIHKSVGAIIESDVMLASASNAIIVGFQVRPSLNARRIAEKEEIDIRTYSVIYKA
ncbi:MAG: translation initiation factor IF-2, partial [Bacteroidota bacterium]|nr:translation initiation factor IF-2 [Bacteroidota bacterium]